jgi:hypothetical protein
MAGGPWRANEPLVGRLPEDQHFMARIKEAKRKEAAGGNLDFSSQG